MPLLFVNPKTGFLALNMLNMFMFSIKWVTAATTYFGVNLHCLAFLLKQRESNISSEISFLPVIVVDILRIDTITCNLLFFKSFRTLT